MIEWHLDSTGGLAAKQEMTHPAIYLDHWAIRKFAGVPELGMRFVAALKASKGTWAVSLLNLMEFIKMTDESQAVQFEELLEQALPDIFFIDFQALDVIEREREMLQCGTRTAPYGDVSMLSVFAHNLPDTPRPFTAKNLVTVIVKQREQLQEGLIGLNETIISRIQLMSKQMLVDKQFEKTVKGSQESAKNQRTWFFLRELLGSILREQNKVITQNDAMDLFHTIVPVAYCDFVLLDAQWEHRVKEVNKRVIQHNVGIKSADIFSEKSGGLERFLKHLESYH